MAIVLAWFYLLAGLGLHTGRFSIARVRQFMRGNWVRVALIFILLSIVLRIIDYVLAPVKDWLIGVFTDSTVWTVRAALIRFVVDFPFQMLWIVTWGVTIGIILHTLERSPARLDADQGT
jgi:hypothetical protein